MARARQYIEWVDAAHVFPCAGPPCFLDDDLFAFNDFDRDPANIFPDQTVFLDGSRRRASTRGELIVPGSVDRPRRRRVQGHASRRPTPSCAAVHRQARVPRRVPRATGRAWLAAERASWSHGRRDLVAELAAWFEPLLERAPITSAGIAGNVVLDVGEPRRQRVHRLRRVARCGVWRGEPYVYKVDVDRRLIEALVERPRRGLGELAVPVVPVRRAPPDRRLQRVRHDVLQGAVARTHRVRRALLPRRRAARPTSSSSATAGASSAGARTARPTSPASARSTTACSRAACTTGSSTSRPAAASRATTGTSGANVR